MNREKLDNCAQCGKPVPAGKFRFCSVQCGQISHNERRKVHDTKPCPICGKPFPVGNNRAYCSIACRDIAAYREHTCPICQTVFTGNKNAKYCSEACRKKGRLPAARILTDKDDDSIPLVSKTYRTLAQIHLVVINDWRRHDDQIYRANLQLRNPDIDWAQVAAG